MPQRLYHNFRALRPTQQGRTMAFIEPSLERAGKPLMIFALDFESPWLGMQSEPRFSLIRPLPEKT
jgi:hypothetical protein